ncbi:MAG: 4-alpha-glucanotransferase [Clostridia bacterium]|nr:4-alpha-glucanotransferase [Clostridia bacterium]
MRGSGILLHITSLPSPFGIGTLGRSAYDFADFLEKSGQRYWQILPVGHTGFGDSPYQAFSAFAGNPYMIDLDLLCEKELLRPEEYVDIDWGEKSRQVDYGKIFRNRTAVLRNVAQRFKKTEAFELFCSENAFWLEDYSVFMSLKERFSGRPFFEWKKPYPDPDKKECDFWKILQFIFYSQWYDLKKYVNSKGIQIIGDLPIYVAHDSSDVMGNPELFELDLNGNPVSVAGVPPDGFSPRGQLWGNPVFDWNYMRRNGYRWWIKRISHSMKLFDRIRIDHFRGFSSYYSVPSGNTDAVNGFWRAGPSSELFEAIESEIGKVNIIAEDLGFIDNGVRDLMKKTGFPGMKILQFAFDSREGSDYLPHNYGKNCVVYIGTHDNDTLAGWFDNAPEKDVEFAKKYLRLSNGEGMIDGVIKSAMASVGETVIFTMQDLLGLGSAARMNTPSQPCGNWRWRALKSDFSPALAEKLLSLTRLYGR